MVELPRRPDDGKTNRSMVVQHTLITTIQSGKETKIMRKANETKTGMKPTILTALVLAGLLILIQVRGSARAASAAGIDADIHAALMNL